MIDVWTGGWFRIIGFVQETALIVSGKIAVVVFIVFVIE